MEELYEKDVQVDLNCVVHICDRICENVPRCGHFNN